MLLALRLLYEKVSAQILFPVIGGARKRKLRVPVPAFYSQKGEVELKGIAIHSSLGEFYVTGTARAFLESATANFELGIIQISASATVPLKGAELKFQNGYEPPFSSVTLGTRIEISDDEEAMAILFLGSQ